MNDTKVFRARLRARAKAHEIELFLLRPVNEYEWEILIKPGKHVRVGDVIFVGNMRATVLEKKDIMHVRFDHKQSEVFAYADAHGEIPIPPYVQKPPERLEEYQTLYAKEIGSVAAPTAGFHFTHALLDQITKNGIDIVFVTLHVGLGTFRPMKTHTIEEHVMHSEYVTISAAAARKINEAKHARRRVIAVGTTTVRALEGAARATHFKEENFKEKKLTLIHDRKLMSTDYFLPPDGFSGDVNIFITPGFPFRIVDALITNFHLPKSTLLVLVSAFAGRENILAAYEEAIRQRYRFYSFGDAMFIV